MADGVCFARSGFVPTVESGDAIAESHGIFVDERHGGEAHVHRVPAPWHGDEAVETKRLTAEGSRGQHDGSGSGPLGQRSGGHAQVRDAPAGAYPDAAVGIGQKELQSFQAKPPVWSK